MQVEKENTMSQSQSQFTQFTQKSKKKQLSIAERRELRASYRNLNDETEGLLAGKGQGRELILSYCNNIIF